MKNVILAIFTLISFNALCDNTDLPMTPGKHNPYNEFDALLDGLHEDAHKGNFETYFDRYSSDAVFLGTDKTERWSIEEFQSYAESAFADGHGWTYKVIERNWSGYGDIRWFDEILFNEKLGHCRGTGVVVLINDEWKIAHYALTMLVPNSIATDIGVRTRQAD